MDSLNSFRPYGKLFSPKEEQGVIIFEKFLDIINYSTNSDQ